MAYVASHTMAVRGHHHKTNPGPSRHTEFMYKVSCLYEKRAAEPWHENSAHHIQGVVLNIQPQFQKKVVTMCKM